MGHVLKANRVRFEEPVRMSIDGGARAAKLTARPPEGHPHVRIVEDGPESAVLEVTCSCGAVVHVRCEYAATGGAAAAGKPGTP